MSKVGQSSGSASSPSKTSKPSKDWKSKGTYVSTILPIELHIATSPNLLPVVLTFVSQEEVKGSINVDALDRKSTRLNSSHSIASRMPSSA